MAVDKPPQEQVGHLILPPLEIDKKQEDLKLKERDKPQLQPTTGLPQRPDLRARLRLRKTKTQQARRLHAAVTLILQQNKPQVRQATIAQLGEVR